MDLGRTTALPCIAEAGGGGHGPRQPQVGNLQGQAPLDLEKQEIFRFDVEVRPAPLVHVGNAGAGLPHQVQLRRPSPADA